MLFYGAWAGWHMAGHRLVSPHGEWIGNTLWIVCFMPVPGFADRASRDDAQRMSFRGRVLRDSGLRSVVTTSLRNVIVQPS